MLLVSKLNYRSEWTLVAARAEVQRLNTAKTISNQK